MQVSCGPYRGFTLIELIVALTVMACAAGLIVPRIGGSLARQDLYEEGQRLMLTARTARELAVVRRQPLVLQIDLDHNGYSVAQRSSGGTYKPVQTSWLKAVKWSESIRAEVRGADGTIARAGMQQVSFSADGSSSGASITLMSDGRECLVTIRAASGKALICKPGESAAAQDQYDLGD